MNKTLLLVICDFLLLNLLALTRWDKPPEMQPPAGQPTPAQTVQQVVQEDLVGALRTSLDEEKQAREALNEQLQEAQNAAKASQETAEEREQRLAAMRENLQKKEQEAQQLSTRVQDSQNAIAQLSDRLSRAAQEAASSRSQSEQLAKELAEKQEAAAQLAQQVEQLHKEREKAQQDIQSLSTKMQVAETERRFPTESVTTLQNQVAAEREEKLNLQTQTGKLAEGVTQLAENSADLRQEIRSNTPINANALWSDFTANRIDASFHTARDSMFGAVTRNRDAKTVLVSDGTNVFALFHVNDTAASFRDGVADWREIEGHLNAGGRQIAIDRLSFLAIDPRIVVVPLDPTTAASFGVKIYPTALEPFKFPQAVIISRGGQYYGEVDFKLDAQTPGYVKMQTKVLTRMFGEFAPNTGDLVFSKTGELLGVMANDTYCVLVDNFRGAAELPFGANLEEKKTSEIIGGQKERILRLPLRLQ
jgi:hypothetical protein